MMNILFTLTAQSDTSFFEDLWNYLYDVYLNVDGGYQDLGFESAPLFPLLSLEPAGKVSRETAAFRPGKTPDIKIIYL